MHRLCAADPITLNALSNSVGMLDLVEGERQNNSDNYLESKHHRQIYINIPIERPVRVNCLNFDKSVDIAYPEG